MFRNIKLLFFHKIFRFWQRLPKGIVLVRRMSAGYMYTQPMNPHTYSISLLLFFICFGLNEQLAPTLIAQKTEVKGTLTDEGNGQPLSFANVFFQHTSVGTLSDAQGNYQLSTNLAVDTLVVSIMGYQTQYVPINSGTSQVIDLALSSEAYSLSEVIIVPPAYPIIRKAIQRKALNDRKRRPYLQYEAYTKIELGLDNLSEKVRKKAIYKPFRKIFALTDTTGDKPYLPLFLTETLSELYWQNDPKSQKEHIIASQTSGVQDESFSMMLGDINVGNVNIYEDNIVLLYDKSFVSPISKAGFRFYEYDLMDSLQLDGQWSYHIHFWPKRKQTLTFEGDIWIEQDHYAVKQVDMKIAGDANVNYITGFFIQQVHSEVKPDHWVPTQDIIMIEAEVPVPHEVRMQEVRGIRSSSYRKYQFEKPRPRPELNSTQNITIAEDALDKTADYWESHRHDSLTLHEQIASGVADSVKQLPIYQIGRTLFRGYWDLGAVEIGPLFSFYSNNPIEGNRLKFGARTADLLGPRARFSAYAAYGTGDKAMKYGGELQWLLGSRSRQLFTLNYEKDVEQLGGIQGLINNDNFLATLFSNSLGNKLNGIEAIQVGYEREWFQGFSQNVSIAHRKLTPRGQLDFTHTPNGGDPKNEIVTTELTLGTHFAWKERFVFSDLDRTSLGTRFPTVEARYTLGLQGPLGGAYNFHKLVLGFRHQIRLGRLGYIQYRLEGGKIWGTLPYPLLMIPPGNETPYFVENAFNGMDFFEFVTDEYVSGSVSYHMEGLLFNRVPLLKKLKWREVFTVRAITGSLSEANRQASNFPSFMSPLNQPYAEASVGVKNILSLLRVDALWRLSHREHPFTRGVGIRVRMDVNF